MNERDWGGEESRGEEREGSKEGSKEGRKGKGGWDVEKRKGRNKEGEERRGRMWDKDAVRS